MPVTAGAAQPEDDDLASILSNIGYGRLKSTRQRLASSQETRQFLEIGLRLLHDDLIAHRGPDFDAGIRSKLFESVSRERILNIASTDETYRSSQLSVTQFRHRWDRKDRYTEDLIAYMFRLSPQQNHLDAMFEMGLALAGTISLEEFIDTFAEAEVSMMLNDSFVEIQTIVQNAMPNHPRVREFCRDQLNHLLPRWAELYERIASVYRLRLRTGWTWKDVAITFNTLIEGELAWARVAGRPQLSNGDWVLPRTIKALLPVLMEENTG